MELWSAKKIVAQEILEGDELSESFPIYKSVHYHDYSSLVPLVLKRLNNPANGSARVESVCHIGLTWAYELRQNIKKQKSLHAVIKSYANPPDAVIYGENDVTRQYVSENRLIAMSRLSKGSSALIGKTRSIH